MTGDAIQLGCGAVVRSGGLLNRAANCRPIIVKATIERASIQRFGPHDVVWRMVRTNDFRALTTQVDDFLKAYQLQVQHSDLDGKAATLACEVPAVTAQ
jgi:hypothetical protein